MDECRSRDPNGVPAAVALFDEDVRHQRIVDGLLARYLARHELELAFLVAKKRAGVDVNAFAAIFGAADCDHVALVQLATLPDPESVGIQYQRRVHPWLARHAPRALDSHVSGKISG